MRLWKPSAGALLVAGLLAACGGGEDAGDGANLDLSGAPGSLVATPTVLTKLTPEDYAQLAQGSQTLAGLLQIAGTPKCAVTFNYFQYGTVGGAGEKTMASGGLMVPSGNDPACTGPRPVVLYAHGTSVDKNKNMASPQDTEAAAVAAIFAAQGYIVVAPNYAGYEASTLPYHPYLNLQQQAQDVVDALTAARKGFAAVGASASPALFVAGYSQGGYVSMAAQRKLQLDGKPVTAGAHSSGPYGLGTFGDVVFMGNVTLGATQFLPLLNTSYQRAYGNLYSTPSDMYEAPYASYVETLLPSTSAATLISSGRLPATALFAADSMPQSGFGFGTGNLIKTTYRNAVLADMTNTPPAHPLRAAAYRNDLLQQNWTPAQPMLLCGASGDPTVPYLPNTTAAVAYFGNKGVSALVREFNVDGATQTPDDGFNALRIGFQARKTQLGADLLPNYHASALPFCTRASKGYFDTILAAAASVPR